MFKEDVIWSEGKTIPWPEIYDWAYAVGNRSSPGGYMISYYDDDGSVQQAKVSLLSLNIDRIDFLLLMAHFKGKYGARPNAQGN